MRLWETGPAHDEFLPTWLPDETIAEQPRKFPRDWLEVEAIIEKRLASFEDRHNSECDEAYERGIQEGMRRQEEVVQKKLEAAREPIAHVAAAVEQELAAGRESTYRQITRLTSALAESWLRSMVAINPHVFTVALRDALEPLSHLDRITVRMSPADHRCLKEGIAAGEEEFLEFAELKVLADPKVDMGGAVAESAGGSVDCRLSTRLEQALKIIEPEHHDS